MAEPMIELIEECADPDVAMVGLLYALPNTQLTRRLAREGRLQVHAEFLPKGGNDQIASGLNFETKRPRLDVLRDLRSVLATVYTPEAYCGAHRPAGLAARLLRTAAAKCRKATSAPRSAPSTSCRKSCAACRNTATGSGAPSPIA